MELPGHPTPAHSRGIEIMVCTSILDIRKASLLVSIWGEHPTGLHTWIQWPSTAKTQQDWLQLETATAIITYLLTFSICMVHHKAQGMARIVTARHEWGFWCPQHAPWWPQLWRWGQVLSMQWHLTDPLKEVSAPSKVSTFMGNQCQFLA